MNPFKEWRERRSWSRAQVAMLAHSSYSAVTNCELGLVARVPRSLLALIQQAEGHDAARELDAAYAAWRVAQVEELVSAL